MDFWKNNTMRNKGECMIENDKRTMSERLEDDIGWVWNTWYG